MSTKPSFLDLARERVVVLDGAMGANLQGRSLDLKRDWLGHENISEVLNFSRPDLIQEIHESFLAVGCDAVETNTFGANEIVMAEADMAGRVFENNKAAAEIARRACDRFETPDVRATSSVPSAPARSSSRSATPTGTRCRPATPSRSAACWQAGPTCC